MPAFVFDIETAPLGKAAQIWNRLRLPILPPISEPFDESSVRLGNLKDAAKIAEKVESARETHAATCVKAVEEHRESLDEAVERAALDARTGSVCAIGMTDGDMVTICDTTRMGEAELLERFWKCYRECRSSKVNMIGHNIFGFDLPFLVRRSWAWRVDVPAGVFDHTYRRWDSLFVDTGAAFALGDYKSKFIKLDDLAEFFATPKKKGNGKHFHQLLRSNYEEAVEYLKGDLISTLEAARVMGLM